MSVEGTQVRKWGAQFYVLFHCMAQSCEATWKSSYFRTKPEAQAYLDNIKMSQLRCLPHRRDVWGKYLAGKSKRPRHLSIESQSSSEQTVSLGVEDGRLKSDTTEIQKPVGKRRPSKPKPQ